MQHAGVITLENVNLAILSFSVLWTSDESECHTSNSAMVASLLIPTWNEGRDMTISIPDVRKTEVYLYYGNQTLHRAWVCS